VNVGCVGVGNTTLAIERLVFVFYNLLTNLILIISLNSLQEIFPSVMLICKAKSVTVKEV